MSVRARARGAEGHQDGRTGEGAGKRVPKAHRGAQGVTYRIGRPPARPRPAYGERAIDYIAAAAHGVLSATAIIFAIGG